MKSPTGLALVKPVVPGGLLALVFAIDAVLARLPFTIARTGALDEAAHLATAALALLAANPPATLVEHRTTMLSALAASVLIDVDHIPLYLGISQVADGGRPFSHSLVAVGIASAAALALPRRRSVLAGVALGLCLHFIRDIATGPGLPLFWPVSTAEVRLPYRLYTSLLVACAALGTLRALRHLETSAAPVTVAQR